MMSDKVILIADLNWTYLNTRNPLVSKKQVQEFHLKTNQEVKVQQNLEQWDGKVFYDSERDLWYIEIIQGTYRDLTIPEFPPIQKMNTRMSRIYFSWFITELIPTRLKLFENYFSVSRSGENILNYSPDSLVPVWSGVRSLSNDILGDKNDKVLKIRELRETKEIKSASDWFKQASGLEIENINPGYLELMLDTSLYFSKVLIQNNKYINWTGINNFMVLKGKEINSKDLYNGNQPRRDNVINPFILISILFANMDLGKNFDYEDSSLKELYHLVLGESPSRNKNK
ncbi:hypothetical protein [Peribacillus frigoritolerans]|uniref:hypothetical protein n=1 Tax=Peribacillus frigoritolerans TaxID=450367 RepID=UPI00203D8C55|nr:hypothetical protein [Peribacillus frigoritolerans]